MSRKYRQKAHSHDRNSSVRRAIKHHDLQPGYVVWLPASATERGRMIRQSAYKTQVHGEDIDQVLPPEAYNHPVVVLKVVDVPNINSNRDIFVIVAMLTSFGYSTKCEGTERLSTTCPKALWGSYLAIHPSTHPSKNTDILYLQKDKLDKPSYVRLARIHVPISALQTYSKGLFAKASDFCLTDRSLGVLFRGLGMEATRSGERELVIGRRTSTIPLSPSLPVVYTPSTLYGSHSTPTHLQTISVREDTRLVPNIQRSPQRQYPISHTRSIYGSTDTWSLPPPVTWNHHGRTSRVPRSSISVSRANFLHLFTAILCLSIFGLIILYAPWAFIGLIFTRIGHFLTSVWFSCSGYIAHGWSYFVGILSKSWHIFVEWVRSLVGK